MKQVLFITGFFYYRQGGAEYQALLLANKLVKKYKLSFVFRDHWQRGKGCSSTHGNFTLYPIRPFTIRGMGKILLLEGRQLYRWLEKAEPDTIYVRGANVNLGIAAQYSNRYSAKLVWHIASDRDLNIIPCLKIRPWLLPEYKIMQYGIRHADTIIAQTQYQAEQLKTNYNREAIVIPNAHPVPEDCKKEPRPVQVLWIANWKPIKQPEFFVKLVEALCVEKNVRFIMLGRTEGYEDLVQKALRSGIKVMGEVSNEQVNDLLAQSHVLVNTSKQEGFSNTFIQAWMRRVPVVSLQVNPDNILKKEQIGYHSGTFSQLILDVKKLIQDYELREIMGSRARKYAVEHHSLKNMNKIIEVMNF